MSNPCIVIASHYDENGYMMSDDIPLANGKGDLMTRIQRFAVGLLVAYCAYSCHYLWLLDRTASACRQELNGAPNHHELLGAERICSAAGMDTVEMLKVIWPQTPHHDVAQAP